MPMLGAIGLSPQARLGRRLLAGVPAAETLPALTTVGATYHGVWSNDRIMPGYAGPLARAINDLGLTGERITRASVAAARNGADALRITRWYDQSGAGRHLDAGGAASPAMREDVEIGASVAMAFDGIREGDSRGAQFRRLAGTASVSTRDFTWVYVVDPTASVQEAFYFELTEGGSNHRRGVAHIQYPLADFDGVLPNHHGNITISNSAGGGFHNTGRKIATVPQVMIVRGSADGVDTWIDGELLNRAPASAAGTITDIWLGMARDQGGVTRYISSFRVAAALMIDRAINAADVATITASLRSRFAIPNSYDAIVVHTGTSRTRGGTLSTVTRNKGFFERGLFGARRIKTYNLGQDGRSLSTLFQSRAQWEGELYRSDARVVYVIDDAINDVGGLGASTDPAAIYASIKGQSDYLRGLGSNVRTVVATTVPQSSGAYGRGDAAVNAGRIDLNALVRSNGAGASVIADPAADAAVGAYPVDTAFFPDALHQNSAGYARCAPYTADAILSALG